MDESWSRRGMFDLVIGSSTYPIDMYPAARIARKCAARLVYEVHDLWPLSLIELGGMSTRHPFVQLMQAGENYAYRTADRVVSILPKTIDHMRLHGMEASKWVYVPNGIDIGEWSGENGRFRLPDQHEKVIAGLDDEGYFKVAYTGAHGLANGLYTVLDAAEMLRGQKVAFILVGQGPEKNGLVEAAQSRKLERLYFLPPVAKDEIPGLLSRMDALYIGLKNEPLFRFGISPNKLMDYMMAAKPVIYAIQAGNNPVDESGCGISIPPGSAKELADAVVRLQSTSKEVLRKKGLSGQTYVKEHHSYNRLASKFLNEVMG
jgi:glycosyltransferase involved in cell wall biosynthesis